MSVDYKMSPVVKRPEFQNVLKSGEPSLGCFKIHSFETSLFRNVPKTRVYKLLTFGFQNVPVCRKLERGWGIIRSHVDHHDEARATNAAALY